MIRSAIVVCVVAVSADVAFAARPVTFEDLLRVRRVAAATVSPDGQWVLYTIRQWETSGRDREKKEQRSQIWRVSTSGADNRPLTFDEAGASAPGWSPDGRYISFLAARPGSQADEPKPQIWIMRADGGDAVQITTAKDGVVSYAWSPDSTRVAYVSRAAESSEEEARRKRGDDRRIFESEFRLSELWVTTVAAQQATQITPTASMAIRDNVSWSPDGTRLVFSAAPTTMLRDDRQDLYIATIADKKIEKITTNVGSDSSPTWSPDGGAIAFLAQPSTAIAGPDGLATADVRQAHLALFDVHERTVTDALDQKFDIEPRGLAWTPDSRKLIFGAGKGVYNEVFSYEPAARRYAQLTTNRVVALGTVSTTGSKVAFVMESATEPADVYVSDLTLTAPRRLTTANPQMSELALGESEVISWKNEGLGIEGVLLKPVGFKAGVRYPLLVVVHGGPGGAHLNNLRIGYGDGGQHWAGQGWAVLYPNPRGGTNYGEKFLRANIPDWGGGDFRDIMTGVDAVIARGIADPDRLAIQGWSYGGYMTSWAITQTTRFKAAMVGAGITNLWSMYGTNDLPNYLASFFGGVPSAKTLPLYMERSAVAHVDTVRTPALILHGGSDERVPIGQPMEFYRALKEHGTPTELVFYPRQGHGLQEYYHQLDRLRRQFEWITKYTLGDAGRKTTSQ